MMILKKKIMNYIIIKKKVLKFINSYIEYLLQIIKDNCSMINLFKDKIMDNIIEVINFWKKFKNIYFILVNKN